MFELTNEQRKCLGLNPVSDTWKCLEIKPSPYDDFKTIAYLDNNIIVKCVVSGEKIYTESELYEAVSEDCKYLMPKTTKGKASPLTSSNLQKRTAVGMCLSYCNSRIEIYNNKTQCTYYSTNYEDLSIGNISEFEEWVNNWCNETTEQDITDIENFSQQKRRHIKFNEGDVFCFKITRRLYGYGRILLDYDKMRKEKQPFWDILMTKPLVCSVYHIITERTDLKTEELSNLNSLPSTIICDNKLYYGEYRIIGNIPINKNEDYPVLYGSKNLCLNGNSVCLQHGKIYKQLQNQKALYTAFTNNHVSFSLNVKINILTKCIESNSNEPYWDLYYPLYTQGDLRNPKFRKELSEISKQMDIKL